MGWSTLFFFSLYGCGRFGVLWRLCGVVWERRPFFFCFLGVVCFFFFFFCGGWVGLVGGGGLGCVCGFCLGFVEFFGWLFDKRFTELCP